MLREATGQPDILEVISDLSNDEVFTPPKVANAVLDLLPAEVWSNPELRWLDPGCKTGVFLREVTRRLLDGLSAVILDEGERLRHILTNQVFGIAITELTALMSRRTLYCSKDASGPRSAVTMPTSAGNVWMQRVEHPYTNGRCPECSASESLMERENRENHAYGFIHQSSLADLDKEFDMKFDVIVGNPPYQMDSDGGTRTIPLYNLFVEQAKELNPRYIAMITPSRWTAGGLGLGEFRGAMLNDRRIRALVDYPAAAEVFPGVEIKGGVLYFLWDRDNPGPCRMTVVRGQDVHGPVDRDLGEFDVLVRDSRALDILHKVLAHREDNMTQIMASNNEYGIGTNYRGIRRERTPGMVAVHGVQGGRRVSGWMPRDEVTRGLAGVDRWKVLIPKSFGAGDSWPHQTLGQPLVAPPPAAGTQTYVFVYADGKDSAHSIESYVRTRFFRFLVSLRKISQHAPVPTYVWVPQQTWDRTWNDAELYAKYAITEEEQAYIAEMVREMSA